MATKTKKTVGYRTFRKLTTERLEAIRSIIRALVNGDRYLSNTPITEMERTEMGMTRQGLDALNKFYVGDSRESAHWLEQRLTTASTEQARLATRRAAHKSLATVRG